MTNLCLAIIGAGAAALPFINKAKLMNVKTVAFARNDSVAKNDVDIFVEENSFDVDFICNQCRKLNVTGVLASNEMCTEVVAKVANRLNLPGNDVTDGFAAKNKYIMRSRAARVKTIKQPKFDLFTESGKYEYPIVVKSVDAGGKRGMSLVKKEEELPAAVAKAKQFSSTGQVLVEEYLEGGKEYSIECLAYNGNYEVIQYTEKEISEPPYFAEIGHHQPANISLESKEKIDTAIREILPALGIECGMAHLELKIINGDLYFIEVGARAGGDHIGDTLVPLSTDFDYYKAAIMCSLGIYEGLPHKTTAHSGIYFHCQQNQKLDSLFEKSKNANWSVVNTLKSKSYKNITSNIEAVDSGYVIYCADKKITLENFDEDNHVCAVEINALPNAYSMIWNHCKEIGRNLTDDELDKGIKKFLTKGHVISIIQNEHITGFTLLYCNQTDTLDAYICNVHVLESYRGLGYCRILFDKAVAVCKKYGFRSVSLHVGKLNDHAQKVYTQMGFKFTGNEITVENIEEVEMRLVF